MKFKLGKHRQVISLLQQCFSLLILLPSITLWLLNAMNFSSTVVSFFHLCTWQCLLYVVIEYYMFAQ